MIKVIKDDSAALFKAIADKPMKRIAMHALGHGAYAMRQSINNQIRSSVSDVESASDFINHVSQRPSPMNRIEGSQEVMRVGVIQYKPASKKVRPWYVYEYGTSKVGARAPVRRGGEMGAHAANVAINKALVARLKKWRNLAAGANPAWGINEVIDG